MKHDKRCPKCESEVIGVFPKTTASTAFEDPEYGTAWSEILEIEIYVCGNCGYLEPYLAMSFEDVDRQKIAFSWLRTPPNPAGPFR
ncbi:MAG: hypothetical protein KJO07_13860 [Deltaproteobacteria bacterium]|nr:hypothetical protein [Deltaproteobacteria bacterium]